MSDSPLHIRRRLYKVVGLGLAGFLVPVAVVGWSAVMFQMALKPPSDGSWD